MPISFDRWHRDKVDASIEPLETLCFFKMGMRQEANLSETGNNQIEDGFKPSEDTERQTETFLLKLQVRIQDAPSQNLHIFFSVCSKRS